MGLLYYLKKSNVIYNLGVELLLLLASGIEKTEGHFKKNISLVVFRARYLPMWARWSKLM